MQKDTMLRRDTQSYRFAEDHQLISKDSSFRSVDGLRKQLDDNSMQREQLEKMQFNVAEEIRAIRNRLEIDAANLNALTSEVRQRTRKLEDDHRLTVRDEGVVFCRGSWNSEAHVTRKASRLGFWSLISPSDLVGPCLERFRAQTTRDDQCRWSSLQFIPGRERSEVHRSISSFLLRQATCSLLLPRLNEYRDLLNEIRTRLEFEREDRRMVETQLASK